jgi:nanoRNase/pAp phosphatase (c-di-AMP/oligoRNAs hydrolase)
MAAFPKIASKRIVITFHLLGDLDAVASAIALCRFLGKKAVIAAPDRPTAAARRLLEYTQTPCCPWGEISHSPSDFVIALDSSSPRLLPHLAGVRPDLMVDHHARRGGELSAKKVINDPAASSTCEMLYFLLKPLDRLSCISLLIGMLADSAHFKYATPRTFLAASRLLERSNLSYSQLLALSEAPESLSERIEALRSCESVTADRMGEHIVAVATAKSHEAHFADLLIHMGADAAFVGCEGEEGRISARMRKSLKGILRLDSLMYEVGKAMKGSGGGHECAAGATGEKGTVHEALSVCRKLCEQQIASHEQAKVKKIEW